MGVNRHAELPPHAGGDASREIIGAHILVRHREPPPPLTITAPDALRLTHEPGPTANAMTA